MIFPKPKTMKTNEGTYHFAKLPTGDVRDWYEQAEEIADIRFATGDMTEEQYRLTIDENGARITAATEAGKFRALTTLKQLAEEHGADLPYVEIDDAPDFARRGYMLDISRGRIARPEKIKKIIDYLAELKYNELQLYMESFCFKYDRYPKYTEEFDCLTPQDIRELDAYCKERFIDLVPNQNSFGHMGKWLAQEEFAHLGVEQSETLDVLKPESLQFVEGLYDSLLPHFSSQYVNVCMDEAHGLRKIAERADCDKTKIYLDYLCRLNDSVNRKHGKRLMFWSDMIHKNTACFDRLPDNVTCLEWLYDGIQTEPAYKICAEYQKHGVRYYVCPSCHTHCSFTGRTELMQNNIRIMAEAGRENGAAGFLLTDWGDGGHAQFWVSSIVPIALGGQYAWNVGEKQDGENFKKEYIYSAEAFADQYFFGGESVAHILSCMGNYYLSETERKHNGTGAYDTFFRTFDTAQSGTTVYDDAFYCERVIGWLQHWKKELETKNIDGFLKREALENCNMALLGAEFGIVRKEGRSSAEKKRELVALTEHIKNEYDVLWHRDNYDIGCDIILNFIEGKEKELMELR